MIILYGNETNPKTHDTEAPEVAAYVDSQNRLYDFEHVAIGMAPRRVFRMTRGIVQEWRDQIAGDRMICRVLPDDAVDGLRALDEEIASIRRELNVLCEQRRALLVSEVPRCRRVKRGDLPRRESPQPITKGVGDAKI
jgi:hypothetical protein